MYRASSNSASDLLSARSTHRGGLVLLWIALLVSGLPPYAGAQSASDEYKVKAAFLFHFAQLVNWPAGALNVGDQTITLCIFADEPRLQELQGTVEGKPVQSRILRVHLLTLTSAVQGCNILFLSRDEVRRQAQVLKSLQGQPVLTVGETGDFLSEGGMIQLHLEKDKVRFDINEGVADSSHIKISSQLLLLATSVTLSDGSERGKQTYER